MHRPASSSLAFPLFWQESQLARRGGEFFISIYVAARSRVHGAPTGFDRCCADFVREQARAEQFQLGSANCSMISPPCQFPEVFQAASHTTLGPLVCWTFYTRDSLLNSEMLAKNLRSGRQLSPSCLHCPLFAKHFSVFLQKPFKQRSGSQVSISKAARERRGTAPLLTDRVNAPCECDDERERSRR